MLSVESVFLSRFFSWKRNSFRKKPRLSVLEMNFPNTFGARKLPQASAHTAFTPQTANALQPGGKMPTQTKIKSKRLNHCVNLFELRLSVLGVLSCLHVRGLRGLLAYRVCTPIVFHTLLFLHPNKGQFARGWNPPVVSPLCCSQMSTITT